MPVQVEPIELPMDDMQSLLKRAKANCMSEQDYQMLEHLAESYIYITGLVQDKQTTIKRLRQILFGHKSEKTRDVAKTCEQDESSSEDQASDGAPSENQEQGERPKKRRGHGRNGADAYRGAKRIWVSHEMFKPGDACPSCKGGKVYKQAQPRQIVRLTGQAPVQATVYELEKFRCNLCGQLFTAQAPEGIGSEKYDAKSASIMALLRYGGGMALNRLAKLQGGMGIPLPASTQWQVVNEATPEMEPAYQQLIQEAADGEVVHNDDTVMRVLELMDKKAKQQAFADTDKDEADQPSTRQGVFTTGIVSKRDGHRMALFFTGHQHAGENLGDVLRRRAAERAPPIQMCDALSRNLPKELKVILGNCLAHGRRKFVDLAETFPQRCLHVLEVLKEVYKVNAQAKRQKLSPQQRLELHQAQSKPLMDDLHQWLIEQIEGKHVEPNSSLGKAINYMLKHWKKLTLFLRVPGAPLDNNICERALKMAILHRKNSLFYKTRRGAYVGDLFMSLIHTCQLCDADPFDYLTQLQEQAEKVAGDPAAWMPWNYPAAGTTAPASSS